MKQKTLPTIRLHERLADNIKGAIEKYNKKNLSPLTIQQFRRLSYELLSQLILQDKEIPIKIITE